MTWGILSRCVCVCVCVFLTVVSVSFVVAARGGGQASLQSCDGEQEEAGLRRKYTQEAAESTQEAALPPRPVPATQRHEVQQYSQSPHKPSPLTSTVPSVPLIRFCTSRSCQMSRHPPPPTSRSTLPSGRSPGPADQSAAWVASLRWRGKRRLTGPPGCC